MPKEKKLVLHDLQGKFENTANFIRDAKKVKVFQEGEKPRIPALEYTYAVDEDGTPIETLESVRAFIKKHNTPLLRFHAFKGTLNDTTEEKIVDGKATGIIFKNPLVFYGLISTSVRKAEGFSNVIEGNGIIMHNLQGEGGAGHFPAIMICITEFGENLK